MIEGLAPLAIYCALMSGTPGPNNLMLTASGANFGFARTLPHLFGITAGVFGITLFACWGLGTLFTSFPQIHSVLRIGGAAYLIYLAWKLAGAPALEEANVGQPLSFLEGAAFQLINPKSWMKAATIATVLMPPGLDPVTGGFVVAATGFVIGLPLISTWALFGVAIGRFLRTPARLRVFNAIMGLSLFVLAVSLLF